MKRKIIGIVLSFLMVFSTCSGAVVAAEDENGNTSEEVMYGGGCRGRSGSYTGGRRC